jgi:nucleoside 2-deoxyribosyltransferase
MGHRVFTVLLGSVRGSRCCGLAAPLFSLRQVPRIEVKADGAWRTGTAVVLPGDDAVARSRRLPYQWDAAIRRIMASAQLTIRIDLDPAP